ncbi:MAG TPA: SGNH/GDSL hydrolase family protein [Candidatus Paceibacterota bacterium]|nr:SGNH/GDSL hydrolase family protein [Verrucomicrobiota bacterium]HRY48809.1 SGNH/GDSL hydrolase family protein [Candidatus Paceibacterota bacterium]HSA00381.1 SGNH/GDSL hydrolase family protein [Candidatus Paceibacterota bacterium]
MRSNSALISFLKAAGAAGCITVAASLDVCGASAAEGSPAWANPTKTLLPFWLSRTMEGESVLFIRPDDSSPPRASLLFEPTRILSVRDSAGEKTYEEGRDYIWKRGAREILLPPGSRITFKLPRDLRRPAGTQRYALTHRDGQGEILFGAGHEYHDMQILVTYLHRRDSWPGPVPSYADDRLPRTVRMLQRRQPLRIALLGDSISTGCNASGWANVAPFQPAYQDLFTLNLRRAYGVSVALTNFAVGGTDTAWGLTTINQVADTRPDLVLLAFGMNDASGRPAGEYQANIRRMIDAVRKAQPDTEFILIATMLGNRDWTLLRHELFGPYRDALGALCQPGIVLADMTSLWDVLLQRKKDWDLTGNGVNHPNDFGHRIYAQVLSALLIPPSRLK